MRIAIKHQYAVIKSRKMHRCIICYIYIFKISLLWFRVTFSPYMSLYMYLYKLYIYVCIHVCVFWFQQISVCLYAYARSEIDIYSIGDHNIRNFLDFWHFLDY